MILLFFCHTHPFFYSSTHTYNDKLKIISDDELPNLDESLPDIKLYPTNKFIIGKKKPPRKQKEFNVDEIDSLTSNSLNTKEEETGSTSEIFVFNVKQPEEKLLIKHLLEHLLQHLPQTVSLHLRGHVQKRKPVAQNL